MKQKQEVWRFNDRHQLRTSSWGEHMCQQSQSAGICDIKASRLDKEKREHPGNYSREKLLAVCGTVREVKP